MIDFHCHLDLYPDPEREIKEAVAARIYVLSVTTTPKAWLTTARLAQGKTRIRTALGLHPQLAHERHRELPLFESLLPRTRYVGEVGLDGTPGYAENAAIQRMVFNSVLEMSARMGGRILTIHSRRAADDVLDHLTRHPDAGVPILHWFSGSAAQLARAVDMGCWFSIGPAMLRSEKGHGLASRIPRDRVLTETDGPFGKTGNRPLRPADAWLAVNDLAVIWRMTRDDAVQVLRENLRRLSTDSPDPTRKGLLA